MEFSATMVTDFVTTVGPGSALADPGSKDHVNLNCLLVEQYQQGLQIELGLTPKNYLIL